MPIGAEQPRSPGPVEVMTRHQKGAYWFKSTMKLVLILVAIKAFFALGHPTRQVKS
jgi:hypothetical protein